MELTLVPLIKEILLLQILNSRVSFKKVATVKNSNNSNIISLTPDYKTFNEGVLVNEGPSIGISAMSISDMTDIPRATVVRKCKFLIDSGYLQINEKKQYIMTGFNSLMILPYQKKIFRDKAKFLRKTLNLITIS